MSGGVDSTACALMLKEKFRLQGFFMQLHQPNFQEQRDRVESIAAKLNIPLTVVDLRKEFELLVLDYFSHSYFGGQTPNPCVVCNREVKFGLFLDTIIDLGMSKMATGHYTQIKNIDGAYRLYTGDDPQKDQSYFLSRLSQDQLSKVIFPLGNKNKSAIYDYVEEQGFHDFRGRESQDVCFLENNRVNSFLANRQKKPNLSGSIISTAGKKLGTHNGLFNYTIGQRKGLGISSDTPLYVISLNIESNAVIVGKNHELFKNSLKVKNIQWLTGKTPDLNRDYLVRIRYSHRGSFANIKLDGNCGDITFHEPQRAVTPGQFAVIYDNTELLGSGIIL